MYIGQQISSWQLYVLKGKKPSRTHLKALYAPSEKKLELMDATFDFYLEHSPAVQYAATLQTKLVIDRDPQQAEYQMMRLSSDFSDFAKRVNRSVFGQANRRKPEKYALLMLPLLEGSGFCSDEPKTLHYHVGIGNVPDYVSLDRLRTIIFFEWSKTRLGQRDIKLTPGDEGWMGYITKEVDGGNLRGCDFANAYVPTSSRHS
mgnify:CR=1 FL=1